MIYLDSCAIVKLVAGEPETAELNRWLDERDFAGPEHLDPSYVVGYDDKALPAMTWFSHR